MQVALQTPVRLRLLRTGVFSFRIGLGSVKKTMRVLLCPYSAFVLYSLPIPTFYYAVSRCVALFLCRITKKTFL